MMPLIVGGEALFFCEGEEEDRSSIVLGSADSIENVS